MPARISNRRVARNHGPGINHDRHRFAGCKPDCYSACKFRTLIASVAEGGGFEPPLRFPVNTLSKRAPSATRPPLREGAGKGACRHAAAL